MRRSGGASPRRSTVPRFDHRQGHALRRAQTRGGDPGGAHRRPRADRSRRPDGLGERRGDGGDARQARGSGSPEGVACGDAVLLDPEGPRAVLGYPLLGRAVDGLGRPLDGGPVPEGARLPLTAPVPALEERRLGSRPLWCGVRAIDGMLVPARGARVGIFGPPGAGKSVLLDRIATGVDADAVVFALIGERGAEAAAGLPASSARTLVCAPSELRPGERITAAELAFAQAERLRACGLDVVVIFDSLARFAQAAREAGVGAGEPAGRGGYPASAFARLAALVERAGCTAAGSISLIATVLADAADPADPLAESRPFFP